jgi:hypothetical protein
MNNRTNKRTNERTKKKKILPRAWKFVCCECCVLSGRGRYDGLITRPEESYRLWRVVVCNQEPLEMRRLKPATGLWKIQPQWVVTLRKQTNTPYTFLLFINCCALHCVSSLTNIFLLLRISMYINTVFRELQSNYSSFKTRQIFIRI